MASFIALSPESVIIQKDSSKERDFQAFSVSLSFFTLENSELAVYVNRKRKTPKIKVNTGPCQERFESLEIPLESDLEYFSLVIKATRGEPISEDKKNKRLSQMLFEFVLTKDLVVKAFKRHAKFEKKRTMPVQEIFGWNLMDKEVNSCFDILQI